MKNLLYSSLVVLTVFSWSARLDAASVSVTFSRITSTNAENVEAQLGVEILDQTQAFSDYGLSIGANEVLFLFTNQVGIASNISEIYIDNGPIGSLVGLHNTLGGGAGNLTAFTENAVNTVNPPNLPAGNNTNPAFLADVHLSADVDPGNPSKGINNSADVLGIVYSVGFTPPETALGQIQSSLANGDLRIGFHVRSIGIAGGSDSFVSDKPGLNDDPVVPEPASIVLFGLGTLGMGAIARRRQQKGELELV